MLLTILWDLLVLLRIAKLRNILEVLLLTVHTLCFLESDYLLQILWYFARKLCRKGRTMVRRRQGYDEIDGSVNSGEFDDVSDEEFFQDMMGYGRSGSSFDEI